MLKTIDRLIQFIEYSGMSARQFDLSIGAANGYTLRMKKNHASVGSDVIENIIRKYPELNVVWLITGEGSMLKGSQKVEIPDYEQLPASQKDEIERIIEAKIRERQERELEELLKEVTAEIQRFRKSN